MSSALMTVILLAIGALAGGLVTGFTATTPADVFQHTSLSIFATLMILLSHSMLMFYLIGKGKAVREAAQEGGLSSAYAAEIARVRRPVFSIGALAIALTIAAAVVGAGVDTGAIPGWVHATLGVAAVVANLAALRVEFTALMASARIVAEVDLALQPQNQIRIPRDA